MTSTRISFVLASYNGAEYIAEQLTSILAALGSADEIIVSDDGSSDTTLERIRAIDDPRIRLLSGGYRLGYQGNFARAIAASTGRYIFFSDQDDVCLPARVPRSLDALERKWCVCGDAKVVDSQLQPLQNSHFEARAARFDLVSLIARPSVIGATMACRRDFIDACLPFPAQIPHDMWLAAQAAREGELAVVRDPFILYRRHAAVVSATASTSRRATRERLVERVRLLHAMTTRPVRLARS
ncbi:glycosyltransferase [Sphingomonas sp. FW199]|uniref:glycosyltransferase n=1 Tax=Sphingomonas sp. FW199 TaxID=3400217 RepID=UPI003CF51F66